jgi:hypothetical protein
LSLFLIVVLLMFVTVVCLFELSVTTWPQVI